LARQLAARFALPWSVYVRLLSVKTENARRFYEAEALRGGWTVRQLARQIDSQFYERTALSRDKAAMLRKGARSTIDDRVPPEQELKDPLVLEFLGLEAISQNRGLAIVAGAGIAERAAA
jgi:predicted nuclease of restriction endonuclease-like (RecB) superfamily